MKNLLKISIEAKKIYRGLGNVYGNFSCVWKNNGKIKIESM